MLLDSGFRTDGRPLGSYPETGFEEVAAISNGSGLLGVWPFAQRKGAEAELEIYQLKCHHPNWIGPGPRPVWMVKYAFLRSRESFVNVRYWLYGE